MEEINLSEFFKYYLSKIVWVIGTILVLIIVCNLYNLATRTPLYQSNTTIVLANERQNNEQYTQNDVLVNQNLVSTYSQIIKSRNVLNKVIKNEKLDYSYDELSDMVTVSSVEDTEVIKISVKSEDIDEALRIADAITPVFTKEVKRLYNIDNVNVLDKASASTKPCNIHFAKENILYVLIGFVVSSGVIFMFFYFDTSVKNADEVEDKFNLTVLGVVPKVRR